MKIDELIFKREVRRRAELINNLLRTPLWDPRFQSRWSILSQPRLAMMYELNLPPICFLAYWPLIAELGHLFPPPVFPGGNKLTLVPR